MQSDDLGLATELTKIATQLEAMADGASFVADGHVRVRDPAYLIDKLKASVAAIERLVAERDEARLLVTEANNSLYGSQGYFHSLNGGPFDKYHLANGIEELKGDSRRQWRRAVAAEALLDFATFSPWLREWCKRRFGKWITHNTAKGALDELRARNALGDT